jgi:hypothetical protein
VVFHCKLHTLSLTQGLSTLTADSSDATAHTQPAPAMQQQQQQKKKKKKKTIFRQDFGG